MQMNEWSSLLSSLCRNTLWHVQSSTIWHTHQEAAHLLPEQLWLLPHMTHSRPFSFCLIVDDFGVKYIGKEHADHLIQCVGSPQVPFLMCTLEIPQKLQHKFFALNFCYLYF